MRDCILLGKPESLVCIVGVLLPGIMAYVYHVCMHELLHFFTLICLLSYLIPKLVRKENFKEQRWNEL